MGSRFRSFQAGTVIQKPRTTFRNLQASIGTTGGIPFNDENLVYLRPNPTTDTPYGYGPLEICTRSISRQLGAAEFAGELASNAAPANLVWIGPAGTTRIGRIQALLAR